VARRRETRHVTGFAYFQNGQLEPAIQELLQATRLMPSRYEPQLDLALAYLSTKQYLAASESLKVVVRLNRNCLCRISCSAALTLTTNARFPPFVNSTRLSPSIRKFPWGTTISGMRTRALDANSEAIPEFRKE